MSAVLKRITVQQYLAHDRAAPSKSEFYDGEIFAMSGGSAMHSLIATNFAGVARERLKDKPCLAFNSDLRIKIEPSRLYTYPDASIVCGELEFHDDVKDTVTNPTVLVEVLSETTERYDRGFKSSQYRRIESLRELILISQDEVKVERFIRGEGGDWLFRESIDLADTLELASIGITIPVAEIYRGVTFPPPASLDSPIPETSGDA